MLVRVRHAVRRSHCQWLDFRSASACELHNNFRSKYTGDLQTPISNSFRLCHPSDTLVSFTPCSPVVPESEL